MIRPPSLQHDYDLISASDEAVNAPPPDADETVKAAFAEKIDRARETGDWTGLLIEGKSPTKFVCRLVPQSVMRRIADRSNASADSRLGTLEMLGLVLRLSVKEVVNLPGYKVRLVNDADWGAIAHAELLDNLPPDIVNEIGLAAFQRSQHRPL